MKIEIEIFDDEKEPVTCCRNILNPDEHCRWLGFAERTNLRIIDYGSPVCSIFGWLNFYGDSPENLIKPDERCLKLRKE